MSLYMTFCHSDSVVVNELQAMLEQLWVESVLAGDGGTEGGDSERGVVSAATAGVRKPVQ